MLYVIEVDSEMDAILAKNAAKRNLPIPALIAEMLKLYVIDKHIMEQNELWENGFGECAELDLEWANL